MRRMVRLLLLAVLWTSTVGAQDLSNFEKLLLPVMGPVSTGSGNLVALLAAYNRGTKPVVIFGQSSLGPGDPSDSERTVFLTFRPGVVSDIARARLIETPAQFLYVERVGSGLIQFNLRVLNTTRQTFGAEIPIVRENDLFTDRLSLLNVPDPDGRTAFGRGFRKTLRIYAFDAVEPEDFLIVVYREFGFDQYELLETIRVSTSAADYLGTSVPMIPSLVQIDNFLDGVPFSGSSPYRVEIRALDPDVRFWAMISLTDNATGHTAVITPN